MRRCLAPLLTLSLLTLLTACAVQPEQPDRSLLSEGFQFDLPANVARPGANAQTKTPDGDDHQAEAPSEVKPYELPVLADSVLERGFTLVGTPYRYGGSSKKTGFDCSGFVGFLFRKEAGIDLPRSTREMIKIEAPKIQRSDLKPGDVVFFNNRGRGRVSHTGIYIGDDQFIHSASRRSGGVRVDSLDDTYWRTSFMQAKRILALAPTSSGTPTQN